MDECFMLFHVFVWSKTYTLCSFQTLTRSAVRPASSSNRFTRLTLPDKYRQRERKVFIVDIVLDYVMENRSLLVQTS